jgi:hypothetical protein
LKFIRFGWPWHIKLKPSTKFVSKRQIYKPKKPTLFLMSFKTEQRESLTLSYLIIYVLYSFIRIVVCEEPNLCRQLYEVSFIEKLNKENEWITNRLLRKQPQKRNYWKVKCGPHFIRMNISHHFDKGGVVGLLHQTKK